MRRPKLVIAAPLLLLWLAGTCSAGWLGKPFLEPINKHENVTWEECELEENCAFVRVKENTDALVELLRLNADEKPEIVLIANTIGIEIADDTGTPSFFLQSSKPGDYEAEVKQFLASVSLTSQSDFFTATIFLDNVNDNPPIIQSKGDCEFEEDGVGDTECTFTVTDVDGSACFLEMIVSDDHFELHLEGAQIANAKVATYRLKVVKKLDYETYRLHSMTITAVDIGRVDENTVLEPEMIFKTEITYVVHVLDIPDVEPMWQKLTPSITVVEKTPQTEQFTAVDGDFGLDWPIEYKIIDYGQASDEQFFAIDPNTGLLEIKEIDRDKLQREIFNIRIQAIEIPQEPWLSYKPLSTSADIVVLVKDVNDNEPTFDPLEFKTSHDEETPFSQVVFSVKDPDLAENGTFRLFIEDSMWSDNFIVVPGTGYQSADLTLAALNASLLDYEDKEWRTITLKVVAEEVAPEKQSGSATVVITLINLNDEYPVFTQDVYEVDVPENRPQDFSIVIVHADDPDEGDEVTYSLRDTSVLAVDSVSGLVTTINDRTFDYERQTQVTFLVYAHDLVDHQVSSEIIVNVIDLNDEPPTLNMPYESDPVEEHSAPGTKASPDFSATDPDGSANLTFRIDWDVSVAYKQGVIVNNGDFQKSVELADVVESGSQTWQTHLTIKDDLLFDWEIFDTLRVNIEVEDINTEEDYEINRKRNAFLTIYVGDINDQPPKFLPESTSVIYTVEEDPTPRMLGAAVAQDLDGHPHNIIKYSIKPIEPEGLSSDQLVIDEDSGQIFTTNKAFDCEEFRILKYEYLVFATDGLHTTNHSLTINLTDVNDEVPHYPNGVDDEVLNPHIEEHDPGPHKLGCLDGVDLDVTSPFNQITYVIEDDSEIDDFEMRENCFWVIEGLNLDREKTPFRSVRILMRDNFLTGIKYNSNEGDRVTIRVTLDDINDNHPEFETLTLVKTSENTKKDDQIFRVTVTDEDEGDNGHVSCDQKPVVTVLRPADFDEEEIQSLFRVETSEAPNNGYYCTVYAEKDLRSYWGEYELLLKASDFGNPSLSGEEKYSLNIESVNFETPRIEKPAEGDIIRIRREETNHNVDELKDYLGRPIEDFSALDGDDPQSPNGQVSWDHEETCQTPTSCTENLFSLVRKPDNKVRLTKLNNPPDDVRSITMKLTVKDGGSPERDGDPITIRINFIGDSSAPEFKVSDVVTKFRENVTGLTDFFQVENAINEEDELLPAEERRDIYYSIIEGNDDNELFALDCRTNILTLIEVLDYEEVTQHNLTVAASHDDNSCVRPDTGVGPQSRLVVIVNVIDENDEPPRFSQNPYSGTFRVSDEMGKVVTVLMSHDPDTNDNVTYIYKEGSIEADPSLAEYANDNTFSVNAETGEIKLNFSPSGRDLQGAFKFVVVAYDSLGDIDGHRDESKVNVYIVSEVHQVEFQFFNDVDEVNEKRDDLEIVLSEVLGYNCSIEKINPSTDSTYTDMLTHFIDLDEEAPVEGTVIASKFLESETYRNLTMAMTELQLTLRSISRPSDPEEDSKTLTIVLAAVCAVLAVLVIVFSLAFVVRTRSLKQRLEKLTNKKFGSQESGLNREGLAVPGTNRHAIEGSNPVWNHDVAPNFDAASLSSGDSGLIGIEDSPEFGGSGEARNQMQGFGNPGFDPSPADALAPAPPPSFANSTRRGSVNPLAAASVASEDDPFGFSQPLAGEEMDVPRRFSLNPLAGGMGDFEVDFGEGEDDDEEYVDDVPYQSNEAANEPTTEL